MLDEKLLLSRVTERSADRTVTAVVDGNGKLMSLLVDDSVLRSAHPEAVGPAIVEAIARARAGASQTARALVGEILGPSTTAKDIAAPAPASTGPRARRTAGPARPGEDEEPDAFGGLRGPRPRPRAGSLAASRPAQAEDGDAEVFQGLRGRRPR